MNNPQLINTEEFFKQVVENKIALSNDREADVFTSWKVGGQDFYAYGIKRIDIECSTFIRNTVINLYHITEQDRDNLYNNHMPPLMSRPVIFEGYHIKVIDDIDKDVLINQYNFSEEFARIYRHAILNDITNIKFTCYGKKYEQLPLFGNE